MRMHWFGEYWGAPCCDPELHVPTPAARCEHCGEAIRGGDRGFLQKAVREPITGRVVEPAYAFHFECQMRMIIGSVGHQRGKCHCYGGTEEDPRGMTRRQAAIAAVEYYESHEFREAGSVPNRIN